MEEKGSLGLLFDLSFSQFLTPQVIKVLFGIGVFFAAIGSLMFLWSGLKGGFFQGLLFLILTPILFLLCTLGVRIWCELVIVAFRIAENTSKMVEQDEAV